MIDEGFTEMAAPTLSYDPSKDGVWIGDSTGPVFFLPRSLVVEMVGVLAGKEKQND